MNAAPQHEAQALEAEVSALRGAVALALALYRSLDARLSAIEGRRESLRPDDVTTIKAAAHSLRCSEANIRRMIGKGGSARRPGRSPKRRPS
jgi:hypothetical protein